MKPHFSLSLTLILSLGLSSAIASAETANDKALLEQGEYVFILAGCKHCHTAEDGEPLAGGRPLETPFGTFYTPNITPDKSAGIGGWSEDDFRRSLRQGLSPDGESYYPAFPFTSYTRMQDEDILALYAYLMSQPASKQVNPEHELAWYLQWRFPAKIWKWLFFEPGRYQPDPKRDKDWNRGAYIADALAHCGECHTPRNLLGAVQTELALSGNPHGPEDELVPNITPHKETGIGDWSRQALLEFLHYGELPDGEYTSGSMDPVIQGLNQISQDDREALADYLRSLEPIENKVSN